MTTHTQWIEVRSDGAAPVPGWRCDGCGQVKWQDEQPDEACDICAETAPVPETSEGERPAESQPAIASVVEQPVSRTAGETEPAPPRRTRSRNPGLSQEDK